MSRDSESKEEEAKQGGDNNVEGAGETLLKVNQQL